MDNNVIAYTAGILDGEGCVRVKHIHVKHKYLHHSGCVSISNTYLPLMCWLAEQWGGKIHLCPRKGNYKDIYTWTLHDQRAVAFLQIVMPYLIVKIEQAKRFIQLFATKASKGGSRRVPPEVFEEREQLMAEITRLNRRGKPEDSVST